VDSRLLRNEKGCQAGRGGGQLGKGKGKTPRLILQGAGEHSQQVGELHRKQTRAKGTEPGAGEAEAPASVWNK